MHDYQAMTQLVERLRGELDDATLSDVTEVRIRADPVFSPEALGQAYEMLTQDSPLAGSTLAVEERSSERACPTCGERWTADRDDLAGHVLVCPSCGALVPVEGGADIEVMSIARAGGEG